MPTSTRTAHPQNHTNCVELSNPPNLRRGGVLPLPRGTMLRIWAHQCGMVCTRRGGRPCPPGRMHDRFLRNPSANSQLPNGRTESSAPTGRCALSPFVVQICGCILRGRGKPLPYVTTKWDSLNRFDQAHRLCCNPLFPARKPQMLLRGRLDAHVIRWDAQLAGDVFAHGC